MQMIISDRTQKSETVYYLKNRCLLTEERPFISIAESSEYSVNE